MDHQHNHHEHRQQAPAPIAPNPSGMMNGNGQSVNAQNQGMLMGLMTNPALAAAAAASPQFPPAAMLTNPGAFFAMPDMFSARKSSSQENPQFHQTPIAPQAMPSAANINGTPNVYSDLMGNQVQHMQSGHQQAPQMQYLSHAGSMTFPGTSPSNQGNQGNSSVQAHTVAAAAAARAVAENEDDDFKDTKRRRDMTAAERTKQNRDRNREHAKSTRLRKKAYVQKLKELVEGLHAERTEEVRQRRVAIQHLAEMQNVRRAVIRSFLQYHANNERDQRKWCTILEDDVWLKQPVTPYRSFRRSEIEHECRISRGVDSIIADTASLSVMIEGIGSRSARWMQIKRDDFFQREEERTGTKMMPRNVGRNKAGRFEHAVSSLSSSSANSSNTGSSGEETKNKISLHKTGSPNTESRREEEPVAEGLHDYHAKPLPDLPASPERDTNSTSEDSPEESNTSNDEAKPISADSSSGDDSADQNHAPPKKRTKHLKDDTSSGRVPTAGAAAAATSIQSNSYLPRNIAKRGGISHNVNPASGGNSGNNNMRLAMAPAIVLPPFAGLGKHNRADEARSDQEPPPHETSADGSSNCRVSGDPAVISGDVETSSSNSSNCRAAIKAYYHVNEDDMILMEDILMCPFVFRTQDAVMCGALAECVMPGMMRAKFNERNKLTSLEMTYDAMGFMQQLERASGSEMTAQIIPGSLEMALSPSAPEARAITLATPPFQIISVNEPWTRLTKYSQMEAEGVELFGLLEGEQQEGLPPNAAYDLTDVSEGRPICATRLHYDKDREQFVDFICSYPLTNTNDEITHLIHVSKELPPIEESQDSAFYEQEEESPQ